MPKRIYKANLLILFLLLLNLMLVSFFLINNFKKSPEKEFREVWELKGTEDFNRVKEYFSDLAQKKGAPYAFEVLKRVKVAPGTDMHLMGHIVGDILYKQEGAKGMKYCTHDFRNACSHTVVVGLFSDKGNKALPEITEACKSAPGGKGAYNMCFHGLGHGVLAYVDYDLKKAVELCFEIKKDRTDGNEAPECVGGAIMEIISGGDHDRAQWTVKNKEYMETNDPLYPCNADFIPEDARGMCYTYLTPHLFLYAGGELGNPTTETFEKAFTYCDNLQSDDFNRRICFGGFGKEFVVLARARDIREVEKITDSELLKVISWCGLAYDIEGVSACESFALDSLFWGGENDRRAAVRYCDLISNESEKKICFEHLIKIVDYYIEDSTYKKQFCQEIPKDFFDSCKIIYNE